MLLENGQSSRDIFLRFSLLLVAAALLSCLLAVRSLASDNEYAAPLNAFAQDKVAAWIADPDLIAAVKAQNAKTSALDEAAIGKLDTEWREQVGQGATPLIDSVVGNALSDKLRQWKDATDGMVTEIFVMDAVGLNVGASDVTSDYWQGDEAKWQETFKAGPGAVHLGEVELDESTQTFQSQVSMPVLDGGTPIGAITVGLNVEAL